MAAMTTKGPVQCRMCLRSAATVSRRSVRVKSAETSVATPPGQTKVKPGELNLPMLLDMAAVTWQTRLTPKGGPEFRFENRDESGSGTVYMDPDMFQNAYCGVLRVFATVKKQPFKAKFDIHKEVQVRATLGDRQAITGVHGPVGVFFKDDPEGLSARVWMRKDQTASPSIKLEVVRAFSKEKLLFRTHTAGEATMDIDGDVASMGKSSGPQTMKIGDYEVEVSWEYEDITKVELPTMEEDDPTRMNETILFEGARMLGQTFDGGFWTEAKPLAFIENADTLTQVVVYWNTKAKEIAFAFAGTDVFEKPKDWRDLAESGLRNDIITDLEVRPVIFDEFDKSRDQKWGGLVFGTALGTTDSDLQMVHKGYLQAWRSIQPAVELLIEDACTQSGSPEDWKVYFVGHSLGGGMATLATASAAAQGRASDKIALYTLGCPNVGTQAFLDAWMPKVPERWRTFNEHDSIPKTPRTTGFTHPTQGLCLMEEGWKTDPFDTTLAHASKVSFPDVVPEITLGEELPITSEAMEELQEPYKEVPGGMDRMKYEMRLLKNIKDGSGLKQHSTEEYMQHLISVTRQAALSHPPQGFGSSKQKELNDLLDKADAKVKEFFTNEKAKFLAAEAAELEARKNKK